MLYGQRRVGKTSILHQTIRQLTGESALLPVYFDLQGKGRQSLSQVLFQLSREITRAVGLENPPEDAFNEAGSFFAEQVLPWAYAHIGLQRRLLLLFDEFDVLGDEIMASGAAAAPHPFASETLFPYLQNLIMQHDRLAFIFVVGRRIDELPTHFSAIFKQAAYHRISLMRLEDARELIVEPIHGVIRVKDETIHAILLLTAGHPYFTQLICFEAYNHLRSQNQYELSSVDITGLVDQAIETGHGALNWFWEGLPRAERFILSAIAHVSDAQGVASKAAIQQILEKYRIILTGLELQDAPERLVEWEILSRKEADAYRFTVELVRRWMLKAHPLESARRDVDFISKRAVQLYEVAREAHMAGMLEDARDDYRKALAANPNHRGAQLGLAQVLFELGEFEAAVEAFEKAYAIDEMSARDGLVRAWIAVGQKHEEAGHQAEALVEYQKALQYTPQDDTLRRRLANIWLSRASEAIAAGGLAIAYEAYRKPLSLDTDGSVVTKLRLDFDTWVRQAESEQRHEDAVAAFNVLRRLLPDDTSAKDAEAEYYCRYGDNLVSAGHRAEAIRAYERTLELRPDDSVVVAKLDTVSTEWRKLLEIDNIFNDGFVAQQQGDWETAKSCWVQLIKMDVLDHQGRDIAKLLWDARQQAQDRTVDKGDNLVSAGHRAEAIRAYERTLELRPDDSVVVMKLDTVSTEWRKLLEIDNIFNDGFVAQQQGDWETAKSCWVQLIKMDVLDHQGRDIAKLLWDARQQAQDRTVDKIENNKLKTIVLWPAKNKLKSVTFCLFAGVAVWGVISVIGGFELEERLYQAEGRSRQAEERLHQAEERIRLIVANREDTVKPLPAAFGGYQMAAEQGQTWAQYSLGLMYNYGQGVNQDDAEAVKWYRMAAEQGHAEAQNNLGVMYEHGKGVKKDYTEAVKWYRKSAEQGNAWAQYSLGVMYENGRGVKKDKNEAENWLRKAARQGHSGAQDELKKRGIQKW